jgi:hypothetical protein
LWPNRNIRILNYGRASAGVLQMVDMAARQAEIHKPDLLIIAFITRDLERTRRYHSSMRLGPNHREFMHYDKTPNPNLLAAMDTGIIDPRITRAWAEALMKNHGADPLLSDLNKRYTQLRRRDDGRMFDVWRSTKSLLLHQVLYGTIFTRFYRAGHNAYKMLKFTNFTEDDGFNASVAKIKALKVPTVLFHIPEAEELIARTLKPNTEAAPKLMKSLSTAFEGTVLSVLHFVSKETAAEADAKYRRQPHDRHPSLWAKKLVGKTAAELVAKYLSSLESK